MHHTGLGADRRVAAVHAHAAGSGPEVPIVRIVYTRRP
jgi:hypothetical protein